MSEEAAAEGGSAGLGAIFCQGRAPPGLVERHEEGPFAHVGSVPQQRPQVFCCLEVGWGQVGRLGECGCGHQEGF